MNNLYRKCNFMPIFVIPILGNETEYQLPLTQVEMSRYSESEFLMNVSSWFPICLAFVFRALLPRLNVADPPTITACALEWLSNRRAELWGEMIALVSTRQWEDFSLFALELYVSLVSTAREMMTVTAFNSSISLVMNRTSMMWHHAMLVYSVLGGKCWFIIALIMLPIDVSTVYYSMCIISQF